MARGAAGFFLLSHCPASYRNDRGGPSLVEKHVARIFGRLGLPPPEGGNRRVLAVLRYLGG